jgi:hypothetical protein
MLANMPPPCSAWLSIIVPTIAAPSSPTASETMLRTVSWASPAPKKTSTAITMTSKGANEKTLK